MDFYKNNPLFEIVEAKVLNNAIEAECGLCIHEGIGDSGWFICKCGKRPEIIWDEGRDRSIFYCDKYKTD